MSYSQIETCLLVIEKDESRDTCKEFQQILQCTNNSITNSVLVVVIFNNFCDLQCLFLSYYKVNTFSHVMCHGFTWAFSQIVAFLVSYIIIQ